MILYPTETIYALGVNALDPADIERLYRVKGRDGGKAVSWLVRDVADIAHYGELDATARRLVEMFLPGPLTLVLRPKRTVPAHRYETGEVSFRISPDPVAQRTIATFMAEYNAPLTCTSANKSGESPQPTPAAILAQLGAAAALIDEVIDDGPRTGEPSTVVSVFNGEVSILRAGALPEVTIRTALNQ